MVQNIHNLYIQDFRWPQNSEGPELLIAKSNPNVFLKKHLRMWLKMLEDDVFGGHANPVPPLPQISMDIEAGLQNHDPTCIVQRVHHTFHGNQIRGCYGHDIHKQLCKI